MSISVRMTIGLLFIAIGVNVAAGYQGTSSAVSPGAVSAYDSGGRPMYNVDILGNRTGASLPANIAAPATIKRQAIANAAGVTIHVPADHATIQAAIDAAADGDTVLVSDGTYTENINFKGKAITVTSVNGSKVTTIDGGKHNVVVAFVTNEGAGSVLNGFTITNGLAGNQSPSFGEGGGIVIENTASPTITNNVITANGACNGAGIGIGFAGPLIQGNTITNNFQSGCSGGIGGGGISIRGESSGTRLVGNVIADNLMLNSGINGGGLVLFAGGSPLIQNNIFRNNNQFGIAMVNSSTPQFVQNLIIHNTGGGLTTAFGGGTGMTIINNTFADNDAQTSFVAQFNAASAISGSLPPDVIVQNNLLIAKPGQLAVFCFAALPATGIVANNVFSDGGVAFSTGCGTAPTGSQGNVSSDPLFVDPAVDNFHLQPLSPGVDTGNNTTPSALPANDLGGDPRIVNTTIDMGVFEFQGSTTTAFSATSLTYAKQQVGTTSAAQTVTITNTGSTALQITPFVVTGDFTEADDCHTSAGIAGGKSCTISISFAPTATGTRTGQLTVTSNDVAGPTTINLSGIGGAPVVSLSVPSLSFASQLLGSTSAAQSFTLSNVGDEPLTITSVAATGNFAQSNDCGASLAISATCTVNVTFTPTLRGTRNGSITITDNAVGSPHSVTLQGTGIGPAVTLGATSLTFAGQLAGTTSPAQSVTLTSNGETALNITSITASGDFAQTNDCGASVPSGQSCTLQIKFTPTVRGLLNGAISIVDNSTTTPEHITLSGTGTAPVVSLSRTSLAFGNQVLNVPQTALITLTNSGDAPLVITSIVAGGDFSQTNTCGASLAAQASCSLSVTFTPSALGPRIGSLVFTDSALNSPQSVALSGTGVQLGFSSSSLTFGNQLAGTSSAAQAVTVTNPGNSALNFTSIVPSAGFTQTNNCGTSLAGNAACTLNVAFAPAVAGPVNGLITLNYNGTQSTIVVSGTGTDFSVGTQPGGSTSATVNAGATATYNLSLSGSAGLTSAVTLTCSGAPTAATCSVNPASGNFNGTTPVNFTVTVTTTSRASLAPLTFRIPSAPGPTGLFLLIWATLTMFLFTAFKGRKLRHRALAATALGMVMLMAACGGSTPPPPPPPPHGTPAGTSTLIVTASSGTATRTLNLTLNVN